MTTQSTVNRTRHRRTTSTRTTGTKTRTRTTGTRTTHPTGASGTHSHTCSVLGCTVHWTNQIVRTPATYQCTSCTKWFCTSHIDTHGCLETGSVGTFSTNIPVGS